MKDGVPATKLYGLSKNAFDVLPAELWELIGSFNPSGDTRLHSLNPDYSSVIPQSFHSHAIPLNYLRWLLDKAADFEEAAFKTYLDEHGFGMRMSELQKIFCSIDFNLMDDSLVKTTLHEKQRLFQKFIRTIERDRRMDRKVRYRIDADDLRYFVAGTTKDALRSFLLNGNDYELFSLLFKGFTEHESRHFMNFLIYGDISTLEEHEKKDRLNWRKKIRDEVAIEYLPSFEITFYAGLRDLLVSPPYLFGGFADYFIAEIYGTLEIPPDLFRDEQGYIVRSLKPLFTPKGYTSIAAALYETAYGFDSDKVALPSTARKVLHACLYTVLLGSIVTFIITSLTRYIENYGISVDCDDHMNCKQSWSCGDSNLSNVTYGGSFFNLLDIACPSPQRRRLIEDGLCDPTEVLNTQTLNQKMFTVSCLKSPPDLHVLYGFFIASAVFSVGMLSYILPVLRYFWIHLRSTYVDENEICIKKISSGDKGEDKSVCCGNESPYTPPARYRSAQAFYAFFKAVADQAVVQPDGDAEARNPLGGSDPFVIEVHSRR